MRILRRTARTPIGIDVGTGSIKAVQLFRSRASGANRYRVAAATMLRRAAATAPAPATPPGTDEIGEDAPPTPLMLPDEVARLAQTLYRQGFNGHQVVLATPADRLLTSVMALPPRASGAPLEQIARLELARTHRCEPDTFEMAMWDLPAPARSAEGTHVMTAACPHIQADALLDVFEDAGFVARALDVPGCAIARACQPITAGSAGITAILDLGWSAALLIVLHRGAVVYERRLADNGTRALFAALTEQLALEPDVAEYMLAEIGLESTQDSQLDFDLTADARKLIGQHFDAIVPVLRAALDYATHQYPSAGTDRLILVGGGAVPGAAQRLQQSLQVPAQTAALTDLADCPGELDSLASWPAMTLALGLAQFCQS